MKKFITFLSGFALVVALTAMTKNSQLEAKIEWKDPYLEEGSVPVYTMGSAVTSFPNDLKNYSEAEIKEFDPLHQYGKNRFYDWDGYKFRAPKLKADGSLDHYYDFYQPYGVLKMIEDGTTGKSKAVKAHSVSLSSFAKNTTEKDLSTTRAGIDGAHWGHTSVPAAAAVFFITDSTGKVVTAFDNWNTYDGTEYGVFIQFGSKLADDKYNTVAVGAEGWNPALFDKYDDTIKASIAYTNHKAGWRAAYETYIVPAGGYVYGWGRATLEGQAIFKTAYSDVINGLLKHGNVTTVPTQVKTYTTNPSFSLKTDVVAKLSQFELKKDFSNEEQFPLKTAHDLGSYYSFTTENDPSTFQSAIYKATDFAYSYKYASEKDFKEFIPGTTKIPLTGADFTKIITFQVTLKQPDSDKTKSLSFNTTIVNVASPVITFDSKKLEIEPYKAFNPKTLLTNGAVTVLDGYDRNISSMSDITVQGMNLAYPLPGSYSALVYAMNVEGQPAYKFITIVVRDVLAPSITTRDIQINYGTDFHYMDGVVSVKDESSYNIGYLSLNGFKPKVAGKYKIELEAVDAFGNSGTAYYFVTVLSEEASPASSEQVKELNDKMDILIRNVGYIKGYIVQVLDYLDALFQ